MTRTRKNTQCSPSTIITQLLELLANVKAFHWKTRSYSEHISSDRLYTDLGLHVDQFVEVFLGKIGSRPTYGSIRLHAKFDAYLKTMEKKLLHLTLDTDLASLRDQIVADLNQYLYLASFH